MHVQRIEEIGEILAAGLMRLSARKSSAKPTAIGESSLDFLPNQSGHPNPVNGRETDD
ncbi:hypothetical protein DFP91_5833 [Pseudorhodoplanes sinuspersici]|nr:hypothetical protein DFP91_5833 [Pseudorhodoplanes sinuspersici]